MLHLHLFIVTLRLIQEHFVSQYPNMNNIDSNNAEELLKQKGVRPTANRILILKTLQNEHRPMSLSAMEAILLPMDKSSIFRVLTLFLEHDIVHAFEDGKGALNYELCSHHDSHDHTASHAHFYCEKCARTFCLKDIPVENVALPDGFKANSLSFIIKGECPECSRRK